VDELVVVTEPPGAGKSSVSEELAKRWIPSALVPGDAFFGMIKQGYLLPWLPESRHQNTVIIEAAAAATGGCAISVSSSSRVSSVRGS
jgi:hypothetical protein